MENIIPNHAGWSIKCFICDKDICWEQDLAGTSKGVAHLSCYKKKWLEEQNILADQAEEQVKR